MQLINKNSLLTLSQVTGEVIIDPLNDDHYRLLIKALQYATGIREDANITDRIMVKDMVWADPKPIKA